MISTGAVSAGSAGGDGRAIGLLAAVTAVLLIGLIASFARLLLAQREAAARRRRR